ncbi:MAG: serine--tRNA ligase [Kosmotoga sp.]|uniref:serine--tRNA ligase n=1 Tax=Kosmotoga sp. TaxID=1955248 RepID=UPI001D7F9103|nr:serine--tRNA ligase [Kosmotoga sp.]MBO8166916.1 serine--tRNA ligase [Kosmotoga sp.]
MIDIKIVRNNPEVIEEALKNRNVDPTLLEEVLKIDVERRKVIAAADKKKAERNAISSNIAKLMSEGKKNEAQALKDKAKKISQEVKELNQKAGELDELLRAKLLYIPNIPHSSVPIGSDENDNIVVRKWGEPRSFDFEPKPHWELGVQSEQMDFDRAAKLSGSRFVVLRNQLAKLERALINFMLDLHTTEHGYQEVSLPHLVKRETMLSTGQLPKFEEEAYKTEPDDLFLIPTAEVPLVGQHRDEILEFNSLPRKYTAYTPCYRREAGSYGRDVKGMIRVHQFDKVELVWFTHPESSYDALETLTANAEEVLKRLKLPYRVVSLCSGDLGFAAAKTYDLEVWLPSYNTYREISSCSNVEDFQARRGNIRFRNRDNKLKLVHTLNGSGLAVGRTLVAIVENYQLPDGRIQVPEVLIPYMGLEVIA